MANMSIAQLEAALQTNPAVYKEKQLEAGGDSACNEYSAINSRIRMRIRKLNRTAPREAMLALAVVATIPSSVAKSQLEKMLRSLVPMSPMQGGKSILAEYS